MRSTQRRFADDLGNELAVYGLFVYRRVYKQRRVRVDWLCAQMRIVVAGSKNIAVSSVKKYSTSWCKGFCVRWDISRKCRTNTKLTPLALRLPRMQEFVMHSRALLKSEPQRCPRYGRFPKVISFAMDQSPMPFGSTSMRTTLHMRGDRNVCIAAAAGDDGSRFCSLQITVCGLGSEQTINIEIIFKGGGKHVDQKERDHYATLHNLTVRWQPAAWADQSIMVAYLIDFRRQTLAAGHGEVLLGMDKHGSQSTPLCKALMELLHIKAIYTPSQCTDHTSPVDHHVTQKLKKLVEARFDATFESIADWEEVDLSDQTKRMLIATWVSEAWAHMCEHNHDLFEHSFVNTGVHTAIDGSEDDNIYWWPKEPTKTV